ncbi:hypothetical protein ACJMK2_012262 [Sinanodonta woodiana]|uniref:Uncharacterized protein n=1 Tax=Sinanodonta woodiana TaxID=1069815 RepID=A0ABD3V7P2_SINWO
MTYFLADFCLYRRKKKLTREQLFMWYRSPDAPRLGIPRIRIADEFLRPSYLTNSAIENSTSNNSCLSDEEQGQDRHSGKVSDTMEQDEEPNIPYSDVLSGKKDVRTETEIKKVRNVRSIKIELKAKAELDLCQPTLTKDHGL